MDETKITLERERARRVNRKEEERELRSKGTRKTGNKRDIE